MTKKIASIYFSDVRAVRALYGGYYNIPAVPKGDAPFILTVPDKIQRSQEPSADGQTKVLKRDLIDGRDIATDILKEWTAQTVGMTPECRPGIWIVRDEVPMLHDGSDPKFPAGLPMIDADQKATWREATSEEKAAMWDEDLKAAKIADANWAEYLIQTGDALAEDPKQWIMIGQLRRTACRHYGREREWLQELKDSDTKKCPYCRKSILKEAIKCQFCAEVVDVKRYAEKQAERDAAIAEVTPVRPPIVKPQSVARA